MSSSPPPPSDQSARSDRPARAPAGVAAGEGAAAAILQRLPDVVIRHDRDGRILFANDAARVTLGLGPEELIGRFAHEVCPTPEITAQFAAARAEVFATGEPVAFEVRRAVGDEVRWLEYRMLPEAGATGSVETVLAIGRDITATRRAMDALRDSEARYRALVEATSQVVWGADPGGGGGKELSAGWLAFTGQQVDAGGEFGDQWLEAVHPDDRERALATWTAAVRAESAYEAHYRARRWDGEWRDLVARAAPVRDSEGRVCEWIGTITDVTEREEERARLVEAQRIARLGSWSWEASEGRVRVSEGWEHLFGTFDEAHRDPEALLRRLLVPEEHARLAAKREAIDRDRLTESEGRWRILRPDGVERVLHTRSRWRYDADGRRVAGSGTFQDVTEQVAAEARLVRQQALFEESQRLANVGSWEADIASGEITWSDQMYRIVGLPPGDGPMTRERVTELIAPEDRGFVRARINEGIASGQEVEYEHGMVCPDGSERRVLTRARMVPGDDGRTTRVVGSSQDVTEQRQLEQQVRQAQKSEALGLLAGSVAHDFNNLLSAILGGAQLARLEAPDGTRLAADLDDIREAGMRAADLTRQLLAFSRKQARRPRVLDLRDTAEQAQRLLRRLLPDDVALDVALGTEPCPVLADAGQLEQVMMNLVMNAGDAIAEARVAADAVPGSAAPAARVTLEVERRTVTAGAAYTTARGREPLREGAYAALVVRDTGAGIDAATLERLFEPFFTTKPEGKGTGLGLATVFGIVSQHEGAIRVDSAPGEGAAFTILLPVVEAPVDASDEAMAQPPRGAETVLLVEDEEVVRVMAARILERNGYRVIAAGDGAEALRVWREHAPAIDVVVTDLRMPEMDGRALAEALRAERSELALVLMSGRAGGNGEDAPTADDRDVFLEKPFTADSLLVHVRVALDRSGVA